MNAHYTPLCTCGSWPDPHAGPANRAHEPSCSLMATEPESLRWWYRENLWGECPDCALRGEPGSPCSRCPAAPVDDPTVVATDRPRLIPCATADARIWRFRRPEAAVAALQSNRITARNGGVERFYELGLDVDGVPVWSMRLSELPNPGVARWGCSLAERGPDSRSLLLLLATVERGVVFRCECDTPERRLVLLTYAEPDEPDVLVSYCRGCYELAVDGWAEKPLLVIGGWS